jgi:hypothetical protein
MPPGGPHDHPLTDLLFHGMHPFPSDIEEMLIELHRRQPNSLSWSDDLDLWAWAEGKGLDNARRILADRLAQPP